MVLFWPTLKHNYAVITVNVGIIILTSIAGFFGAIFAIEGLLCNVFGVSVGSETDCVSTLSNLFN